MEYWGEVCRYTKQPKGKGFAVGLNFKKFCYIGWWNEGVLNGWG